jgi:hypothetical protein
MALLHLAAGCVDSGVAGVELRLAGYSARLNVTGWFWLRVAGSAILAMLGAFSVVRLLPELPWLIPAGAIVGAHGGWHLSRGWLALRMRQRDRILRRELPGFVDRLTVALACGNSLRSGLRLAAVWSHSPVLAELMLQLLADITARNRLSRPEGQGAAALAPALVGLVRLIRNAQLDSDPLGAERQLLQQLECWSRMRGRCAYDLPELWQGGRVNDIEMELPLFSI